ncbi:hypothetical protein M378DRAFT_12091 [Amanita muscaria Koide BX008]|uniref:Wax synthase domain-containing protein n=1 Tax=Amanita muscaria (strain Koide BX008) TaxID=946122 RepID=A0A0C2TA23_AMAMK|nr:hypothetical protein M378DRAFT_12091 [Amanita muscaria Koide BX008]
MSGNKPSVVVDMLLFATLFGLYFLALFVKPSPYRRLIFIPIAAVVAYMMMSTRGADSLPGRGSTIASITMPLLFSASDFILLTEVQRELRRKGQTVRADRMEWRARLGWAFGLFSSPRGIGWKSLGSEHANRSASNTRWTFVKRQIIKLVVYGIVLDLLRWHDRWNPCYAKDGPSITAFGWAWRSFNMFSWVIQVYIQIDRLYRVVGTLSVLARLSSPEEWPSFFGDLRDAYTVRRFWGRTWHQLLRRILMSHARFVANQGLGLKRGTRKDALVQLYTAFFISGLIHSGIDYSLYGWKTVSRCVWCLSGGSSTGSGHGGDGVGGSGGGGGAMSFFLRQPVAIILEEAVIEFANKAFPDVVRSRSRTRRLWWRVLGYLWVLTWFTYCLPMWLDLLIKSGMFEFDFATGYEMSRHFRQSGFKSAELVTSAVVPYHSGLLA